MTAINWTSLPEDRQDIRLVVCDMDGTLLDESGRVPDSFWPLLERMRAEGVVFVPASGRQRATLERLFPGELSASCIAENGNLVVHGGETVSTTTVPEAAAREVIGAVRANAAEFDLGLVLCGARQAYVERSDRAFLDEVEKYYAKYSVVDDLDAVSDDLLKLAVFDFHGAERAAREIFDAFGEEQQVVVSGEHWIDIMRNGVDKGRGVEALQRALGVAPAQTAAFGDYLNDREMLAKAGWSFAMANAHPVIREEARYLAPSNAEDGVGRVLRRLLAY